MAIEQLRAQGEPQEERHEEGELPHELLDVERSEGEGESRHDQAPGDGSGRRAQQQQEHPSEQQLVERDPHPVGGPWGEDPGIEGREIRGGRQVSIEVEVRNSKLRLSTIVRGVVDRVPIEQVLTRLIDPEVVGGLP